MFGPSKGYSKGGIEVGGSHSRFHWGLFPIPAFCKKRP